VVFALVRSSDFVLTPPHEKNAFLGALSASEFALLRSHLAPLELHVGDTLHYCGERIDNVIFPNSGLVAMAVPLRAVSGAGVALVGREGVVGGFASAGSAPAACDAIVQVGGTALRMPASAFRNALEQSPSLRSLAARFDAAVLAHAQQTALCNAAHPVEARICRYLLEVQDRCGGDRIPLTQATLGQLLSVRRTTVTLVAGRLEALGVLQCRRGYMQITDREELERHACECYEHLKRYMAKLFAPAQGISIISPSMLMAPERRRPPKSDTLG
jgi:CRP-like cAMP-binding protein